MVSGIAALKMLPFDVLIGQPLKAAVEAQAVAAQTSIDFIERVGFLPATAGSTGIISGPESTDANGGTLRNVTFKYSKKDEDGVLKDFNLTVPILAIVPIPFLRIDEMTIDFTARLSDMVQHNRSSATEASASASVAYRSWWSPVQASFRASVNHKSSSSTSSSSKAEYTMDIHVRAVQDEMPAGLGRVLNMLESAIQDELSPPPSP